MFLTNLFRPKPANAKTSGPLPSEKARPHTRIKLFNLIDVIWVKDAEDIKRMEMSKSISRLHAEETKDIPAVARFALQASMWFNPETDAWFLGMEAKDSKNQPIGRDMKYQKRSNFIKDELRKGYKESDVDEIVQLLKAGGKDNSNVADVRKKALQVVMGRFLKDGGKDIPKKIVEASNLTLTKPAQMLNPITYTRGRNANKNVIQFLQKSMRPDSNLGDNAHNTHVTTRGFSRILMEYLKSSKYASPVQFLTTNPAVQQVFRVATDNSKLEKELHKPLDKPMTPYKTMVVLDIAQASQDTGNDLYMFGAGIEDRQCPFKDFFYKFLDEAKGKIS